MIRDNELRQRLVDPLPIGANLVAIFDSCHSASLLDLDHFRCNRVFVPWISKGRRRSDTRWNNVIRRRAVWGELPTDPKIFQGSLVISRHVYQNRRTSDSTIRYKKTSIDQLLVVGDRFRRMTAETITRTVISEPNNPWYGTDRSPITRTVSPEHIWPCTGWCPPQPLTKANVMSIAACKDYQLSWEDRDGSSMTKALIKTLRNDPHPTMAELIRSVSDELHKFYVRFHPASRDYRKRVRRINAKRKARGLPPQTLDTPPEMDNFQDPQLSSPAPIPLGTIWNP